MPSRNSSQWQSTRKHSLGKLRRAHPASGATWNVQVVRGKMTSKCLWHACRALVLGMVLMLLGAGMATVGYYANQLSMGHEIRGNATVRIRNESRGFHLNNLSYVGPIVMGFGGFIVVAACVMTFEARDSAAKVVPARFKATGNSKNNVRSNNDSAISNRRANGYLQKTSRWDHHAGLFRTSPAEHPPQPPPLDRQALTAALIHFSKTIGNSPRLSPQQRRFSRSGSVPNLTSSHSLRTHLSPHRKQILFDQNLLSHRHLHHYRASSHGRRLSKSRSARISYSLVHRESSSSLLHPTLLQLNRQARSVDESGPYLRTTITDSPRDSLTSVVVDNYEARLRDRTKRSDTAKRHILARQKPIEKEEPNSPKSILNDDRRRSSATSEASYASRLTNHRRISSASRTPSIDSRSVQVEFHSPDIDNSKSPRTPRRLIQSSTPSVEREFRSQLSICSEPITIRQLSGQSSLEPCVLEESPDSEEKESSSQFETETIIRNSSSSRMVNRMKTIDNSYLQQQQQHQQLPSIHSKKPRPNNLQLKQNQLLIKSNNNNGNSNGNTITTTTNNNRNNTNSNTKNNRNDSSDVKKQILHRSNSSRTFYRPKSKPLNDYDQIYFINSKRSQQNNDDDLYDSLRVINERRSTILRTSESNNSENDIQSLNTVPSLEDYANNSKISGKQVNIKNVIDNNNFDVKNHGKRNVIGKDNNDDDDDDDDDGQNDVDGKDNNEQNCSEMKMIENKTNMSSSCCKKLNENEENPKNVNNDNSIKKDCNEQQTDDNLDVIEMKQNENLVCENDDNDFDGDNKKSEITTIKTNNNSTTTNILSADCHSPKPPKDDDKSTE